MDKGSQDKGQIVARVEAVPEGAGRKGRHAGAEARFFALRGDAQIDVVPQPVVGVLVPAAQVCMGILGRLQAPRIHVFQAIPKDLAGLGVEAVVPHAGEDAGALGEGPHAVVLHSRGEAKQVQDPDAAEEAQLEVALLLHGALVIDRVQLQEHEDPHQAHHSLFGGWGATARDLALLARWRHLGRVGPWGHVEEGGVDPPAVVVVLEGGAAEERREEEDVAQIVEETREFSNGRILLRIRQLLWREATIMNIPTERRQLHDHHHLGASDVDGLRLLDNLTIDVADGHVAHQDHESDPRHQGSIDVVGDRIDRRGTVS